MMVRSYPAAPLRPEVAEARRIIDQAIDAMSEADMLKLAQQLRAAAAAVLLKVA